MESAIILGVDPGSSGGFAVITAHPGLSVLSTCVLEDEAQALKWLSESGCAPHMAYVEQAQAMPKQGVTSMFNYGVSYGKVLGWLEAFGMPYQLVKPRRWQAEIHRGYAGDSPKAKSVTAASRLFPGHDFRASDRARKPHMGVLEAALIAEYGRRHYNSK